MLRLIVTFKCETIRCLVERPGARRAQGRNSQTILICRFDNSPGQGKGGFRACSIAFDRRLRLDGSRSGISKMRILGIWR